MPQSTKTVRPRKARQRTIRLLVRPTEMGSTGVVRIATDKKTADYLLRELPVELGDGIRGFSLAEVGGATEYACRVSTDPRECECECKGFLRWTRCKHVEGLLALVNAARL